MRGFSLIVESKINIYKTIEKAITADYLDSILDYVLVTNRGILVKLFRNEDLLMDNNNPEFKEVIDNALNNGDDIYISLAKITESSFDEDKNHFGVLTSNGKFNMDKCDDIGETFDYGILINKFLFFRYVKRFDKNNWDDFAGNYEEYKVTNFIHDCIIYDEPGKESFQIITFDEWLNEMAEIEGFNELSDDLKKALYKAECEIDMHLNEVNEYEMSFWYGGGVDGAPHTGHDMVDCYLPEIMLDYLRDYISKYIDEDIDLIM